MDIFNNILENYGGRQMQRIFKSYIILSLIIKQLLFSLFFSPDPAVIDLQENGLKIFNDFTINRAENKIDASSKMLLLFDLLHQDEKEITTINELY